MKKHLYLLITLILLCAYQADSQVYSNENSWSISSGFHGWGIQKGIENYPGYFIDLTYQKRIKNRVGVDFVLGYQNEDVLDVGLGNNRSVLSLGFIHGTSIDILGGDGIFTFKSNLQRINLGIIPYVTWGHKWQLQVGAGVQTRTTFTNKIGGEYAFFFTRDLDFSTLNTPKTEEMFRPMEMGWVAKSTLSKRLSPNWSIQLMLSAYQGLTRINKINFEREDIQNGGENWYAYYFNVGLGVKRNW